MEKKYPEKYTWPSGCNKLLETYIIWKPEDPLSFWGMAGEENNSEKGKREPWIAQ
jgi:hypothetical protein